MSYLTKLKQKNTLSDLSNAVNKLKSTIRNENEGVFWTPTRDKSGNAIATIRFLPPVENEDSPIVRRWSHAFQGPTGNWYIELSRTSLGEGVRDPVSEYNSYMWRTGTDADRDVISKQRKRKLEYFTNILVEKDPSNPENEGKVFLFKYGKQIQDIIDQALNPTFDSEEPINPFDLWEGAPFTIKVITQDGYPKFTQSSFSAPKPLYGGNEKQIESVLTQLRPLQPLVSETAFKSYEDLFTRLAYVLDMEEEDLQDLISKPRGTKKVQEPKQKPVAMAKKVESFVEEEQPDNIPKATKKTKSSVVSSGNDDDFFAELQAMIEDE